MGGKNPWKSKIINRKSIRKFPRNKLKLNFVGKSNRKISWKSSFFVRNIGKYFIHLNVHGFFNFSTMESGKLVETWKSVSLNRELNNILKIFYIIIFC